MEDGLESVVRNQGGTRAHLLAITERLMSARGYDGVAIKDIAAVAGVRPAAVFYHFPTKADLVAAALDAAIADLGAISSAIEAKESEPLARIADFTRFFGEMKLERREFCFAGVLAASCPGLPETISTRVERFKATIVGWLAGQFLAAMPQLGEKGAQARGEAVLALAEGALLVARMSGDRTAYARVTGVALPPLLAAA